MPSRNLTLSEVAAAPMTIDWYRHWFNEDYLLVYRHRDVESSRDEVRFVLDVLRPSPAEPILDLCCGSGRHTLALCEQGMESVIGLDLSPSLLDEARETLSACSEKAFLLRGDMLHLPFHDESFSCVTNFFTSFGYFYSDTENQAVLAEMARVLRRGGKAWLDYLNTEHVSAELEPQTERVVEGLRVREERRLTNGGNRLEKIIHITGAEGEKLYRESVRLYSRDDLVDLFASAGIKVTQCFGGYDGRPDDSEAPRLILVGEKDR
jgi:ubiquinone/menaquinone biosynthesis C-methylase UbiE